MGDRSRRAKTRVLAVEDEPDVLRLVSWQLESLGYEVVEAGSAAEALHILSMDDNFDLLFADVLLPGDITGLELARRVRRAFGSRIRVLLTSGYLKEDIFRQGGPPSGGEIPLLPKPYTREGLTRAIEDVLGAHAGATRKA